MKRTKDYLMKIIKKYKMIAGDTTSLPNGNTSVSIELSHEEEYGGRMTINDLAQEMREGFVNMKKYMDSRFDEIEHRLDVIETRLDVIETRLDVIENRLDVIETRLDVIEDKLERNNIK